MLCSALFKQIPISKQNKTKNISLLLSKLSTSFSLHICLSFSYGLVSCDIVYFDIIL